MRGDNVIKDSTLTEAFKQGFDEAIAMRDIEQAFRVQVALGGVMIINKVVNTLEAVHEIMHEHLQHGVGIKIDVEVIEKEQDAPAVEASDSDDDIVDADIVEEQVSEDPAKG